MRKLVYFTVNVISNTEKKSLFQLICFVICAVVYQEQTKLRFVLERIQIFGEKRQSHHQSKLSSYAKGKQHLFDQSSVFWFR